MEERIDKLEQRVPGCLFAQPWWLDTVAPGSWDAVEIEENGTLVARLPFVIKGRSGGLPMLDTAALTPRLGPTVVVAEGKPVTRLARERDLLSKLVEKLPAFASFRQPFDYPAENWLPFYWAGFRQTTRYSYILEELSDLDKVFGGLRSNIRWDIRKAEKQVEVSASPDTGLDELLDLSEMTFRRQGRTMPFSRDYVRRIDQACIARGARQIYLARGTDGKVHAGILVVHDSECAYYLLGGGDPELRNSGATSLCLWEAIKDTAHGCGRFDFEGSMIKPIEKFFSSFGAVRTPYSFVSKTNSNILHAKRIGKVLWMRARSKLKRK